MFQLTIFVLNKHISERISPQTLRKALALVQIEAPCPPLVLFLLIACHQTVEADTAPPITAAAVAMMTVRKDGERLIVSPEGRSPVPQGTPGTCRAAGPERPRCGAVQRSSAPAHLPHRSAQRSRHPACPSPLTARGALGARLEGEKSFPPHLSRQKGTRGPLRVVNDGRSRYAVGNVCGPVSKQEEFSRRRILRPPPPIPFDLMGFEIPLEIRD